MSAIDDMTEVNITRIISAPRDAVYKAWTNAGQLSRWWGPKDFTNPVCEIDVRESGKIHIDMRDPDGKMHPMDGTFHDIIDPSVLVFTTSAFKDADGKHQLETVNTITFNEENHATSLNVRAVVIRANGEAKAAIEGMEEGWSQSLDRLEQMFRQD
jgi:uncharacterized protein YndB with AHSA1/START domain